MNCTLEVCPADHRRSGSRIAAAVTAATEGVGRRFMVRADLLATRTAVSVEPG